MAIDIDKLQVKEINTRIAKQLIILHHYSHAWTFGSCVHALGLFRNGIVVGVAVYGWPVGRNVSQSISPEINDGEVLELTRLWVNDSEGKNTESWFLGQTFKWMKEHDKKIKVLISYSDPNAGHVGTIYQATNWLYQGRGTDDHWYKIGKEIIHPRTVHKRYGTRAIDKLKEIVPEVELVEVETKYRYIYILTDKKERKKIVKSLYHKILPYEKVDFERNNSALNELDKNKNYEKFWS